MNKVIIACLVLAAIGAIDVQAEDCQCPFLYLPVCVGTTSYGNLCQAKCVHGSTVQYTDGACPTTPVQK